MEPDPFDAFHFAGPAQQLGQLERIVQIAAVVGRILGDEADLFDALPRQLPDFVHDRFDRPAAELAAHHRNAAERAGVVAAFSDFHVSRIAGRGQPAGQTRLVIERRIADVDRLSPAERLVDNVVDAMEIARADDAVDFRHLFHQFPLVPLRQTAGDDQRLEPRRFLQFGQLQDGVHRFLFGRVDEPARVDDDDRCVFGLVDQRESAFVDQPGHDFGIDPVFLAAERDDVHFFRHGCVSPKRSSVVTPTSIIEGLQRVKKRPRFQR